MPQPALHRTIVVVDIVGFGSRRRTDPDKVTMRDGLYSALERAFDRVGAPWAKCDDESTGDGAMVLVPADVPKSVFVDRFPHELVSALHDHNSGRAVEEQLRLRLSLHAGEVVYGGHGVAGAPID